MPTPLAFHIVQNWMIHPDWGVDLSQYKVLICNPTIDADACRAYAPDAAWFGSFNTQMLTLTGPDNVKYNSLREAMAPYVLIDPETGEPVFSTVYNKAYFDYRKLEGAAVYAQWIADNCAFYTYLDDFVAEFPTWKESDLPPKMVPTLRAAYVWWREALIEALREARPTTPIIANTAGMVDPRLNGITVEQSHIDRMGHVFALARFATQWTQGHRPVYSVDWSGRWTGLQLGLHPGDTG